MRTYKEELKKAQDNFEPDINSHWDYVESVLLVGPDTGMVYTLQQVLEIAKLHYKSAMLHGFGHGFEEACKVMLEEKSK